MRMTREEAYKMAIKACESVWNDKTCKQIKSALSEQRTGHWITQWNAVHQKEYYYCSECREEFSYDGETGIKMNDYDFCPNCGCPMIDPQESEEQE